MNITDLQENIEVQYCFPGNNASCRKEVRAGTGYIFLFIFLSCVSVCTVFLNLLVIISISHFKQLHTSTNLLVLSLAVSDLLVGLFVMPVNIMQLIDSCWYLGNVFCSLSSVISGTSMSASLCNMVFIAVDRFVAVNDPLKYSTRVTVCKMSFCIIVGWCSSLFWAFLFFYFNLFNLPPPQTSTRCYGECLISLKHIWMIADLVFSIIVPTSVILILYSIIFNVARHQAKAVRAGMKTVTSKRSAKVSRSETKAAKTLGIVIFVYLSCWIPFYISSLSTGDVTSASLAWAVFGWLVCMNSSLNPLIYAIFYPWFRASIKLVVLCKIFSSVRFNLFPE